MRLEGDKERGWEKSFAGFSHPFSLFKKMKKTLYALVRAMRPPHKNGAWRLRSYHAPVFLRKIYEISYKSRTLSAASP